jgi:hypothetical protein
VNTAETTTSTTFVDLATDGPSVTTTIGSSGRAIIIGGAFTHVSDTNQSAYLGLQVDGGATLERALLENNFGGSGGASIAFGRIETGLSAGSHTFKLRYRQSLGGATAEYAARFLLVLPT